MAKFLCVGEEYEANGEKEDRMTVKSAESKEKCFRCNIPRNAYDLKIEPGFSNPDFSRPYQCQYGHLWIKTFEKTMKNSHGKG